MYKVIYTAALDHAVDIVAKSWEYMNHEDAISRYKEQVKSILDEALDNEFLKVRMDSCTNRCLIKIESKLHCIALVKD